MYIITIFYSPPRLGVIVLSCYFTITWITLTNRKRVAEIQKTFIPTASGGSWSFCITYLDSVKVVNPEIKKAKLIIAMC